MNATPSLRRPVGLARLNALLVPALLAAAVAACTGGPAGSASGPSFGPLSSASAAPSASPVASSGTGHVDSADAAFAAVRARSPWFDALKRKEAGLIGQAAWWDATGSAAAWTVTVHLGWGDCPAGCISQHVWTWTVAGDGSVTLQGQSGAAIPPEQQAALAATATTSGIGGEVTAGPTCPVERPGDSACVERPVKEAVLVVKDGSGNEVARFTTDASGLFRIDLPAGTYTVVAQPVSGLMGTAAPRQVTVVAGKLTSLSLGYDTGIR